MSTCENLLTYIKNNMLLDFLYIYFYIQKCCTAEREKFNIKQMKLAEAA